MSNAHAFVGMLMNSRTQTHYFHLQTTSYARHKALEKYYEKIVGLIDSYAEAYMGQYSRIKPVKMNKRFLTDPKKAPMYFKSLLKRMKAMKLPKDSYLKNNEDEISTLIHKTLYLLNLK
jgi:hypothetical protein